MRIGVATLNHPPVNALGHPLRSGLSSALSSAASASVSALVLVAAGKTFPAGADISEFATGKALSPPTLTDVIAELDAPSLPFLTVSCLHGTAFGGGLELALATHYRIAAPDAKIGLPEVGLGLLPGAGGTQRVPRITGIPHAVSFITQGRPLPARKAADWGLIWEAVPARALAARVAAHAQTLASGPTEAFRLSREAFRKGAENGFETQLEVEAQLQAEAGRTRDFLIGALAAAKGEPPEFEGR